MKYIYLIVLSITLSVGNAQQLKQIQKGTDQNQIPVTNGQQNTQVYRDALPYILDTLGIRDTIVALNTCCLDDIFIDNDSLYYVITGDTINVGLITDDDGDPTNELPVIYNYFTSLPSAVGTKVGDLAYDFGTTWHVSDGSDWYLLSSGEFEMVKNNVTSNDSTYRWRYVHENNISGDIGIRARESTGILLQGIDNQLAELSLDTTFIKSLTGGGGSTEYFDPYVIGSDTVGVILQNTQDTVHFIGEIGSFTPESTTVSDTPTLDLTLSGYNISGAVVDGSITPAKLDRTYATITSVATTNTFATSSNTLGDWSPSLEYSIPSTGEYKIELIGKFRSAATTTGASFQIFCSGCTYHGGEYKIYTTINTGTTTNQNKMVTSSSDSVTSATVGNINTDHVLHGYIFVTASTSDAIVAKFASEINGSTVTFQSGTRLIITKIN